MHVSGFYCVQGQGCPGGQIQLVAIVQPDYLDVGNYDVIFYRGNMAGPWTQVARVTGWGNPLGGEFNVTATVPIVANPAFPRWYYGAQDVGEPGQGTPKSLDWSSVPMDPSGTIVADPSSGKAPLYVYFWVDDHNSSIDSIQWQFGDGGTGTGNYIGHTFNQAGNYTVRATITNECGKSVQLTKAVNVSQPTCSSPYGTEGQTNCQGTTLKKCQSGNWVTIQENSQQCGYVPPPPPCTNPSGESGATRCDGYALKQCVDGQWVTIDPQSQQCGYQPPATTCSNPFGANGSTRCEGTTLKKCQNGNWVTVEQNSQQCGYVPPKSPCTGPAGDHGSYACIGTDRVMCNDGSWEVIMEDSPLCTGTASCSNPSGINGATRCVGYNQMECRNGEWVIKQTNSPDCGYVPPGNGGTSDSDNTLLILGVAAVAAVGLGAAAWYMGKKR